MENVQCRKCRKAGTKLFLKGQRCLTPKCAVTRRNYAPGGGPQARPRRKTEFGTQLFEKQKAKAEYGMRERQFAKLFKTASRAKEATGQELLKLLETRLDNVIYRLGWASSRAQARQIVLHRKIKLNDKIANIPSIALKANDKLTPKTKESVIVQKTVVPKWLKLDAKNMSAELLRLPERTEIETDIDEQLITEFYSR